ncbi:MAG: carboxypeptidase regulatory-like domain-containing protein [Vicinamibacteria bacterium]
MISLSFLPRLKHRFRLVAACAALGLLALTPSARATDADLVADAIMEGRIVDQTGATLSGVKITLTGSAEKIVTSDKEGKFRISVPEGFYVVTAEKVGFVAYAAANIELKPGTPNVQEIKLEVALSEAVTVEEQASAVSLDASQNAGALVLKGEDLESLPDDPDELAAALQAMAGNSGGPNGGQIFIDGFTGGRVPSKASIREIRMNSNPFSSEFDRMGFGRIEIITKPGTDTYRGNGSLRFNNAALNTRNPYAKNKPPYQREDYSLGFAGPIAKGKASFSFDSDYRSSDENSTISTTILDSNLQQIDFAQTVTRPSSRSSFEPRIDWQINAKHALTVKYSHSENTSKGGGIGTDVLASRGVDSKTFENNLDSTFNSILGKKINEVRLRFNKNSRSQNATDASTGLVLQGAFSGGGAAVGNSVTDGSRFELTDTLSWATKTHAFRSGFRVRRNTTNEDSRSNFAGVVTFAGGTGPELDANFNPIAGNTNIIPLTSLDRFQRTLVLQSRGLSPAQIRLLGGGATQFVVAGGNPLADVSQTDVGVFLNDDWKKSDRLVFGLGLRGEWQDNIKSRLDLAPRASFAYSLRMNKDGRTPKTVTRGGIGVFYDRVDSGLTLDANRYLGGGRVQYLVTDPTILDTIKVSSTAVVSTPTVVTLNNFSQPQNTRVVGDDTRAPRTVQGSLSLEDQLGRFTGSLTLIASRGDNQLRSRNINALLADGTRPLSVPGAVYQYETTGRNRQFQIVTGLNTRPGRNSRGTIFIRYFIGWAKSDTDGAGSFPANPNDLEADFSRSSSDVRQRVTAGGNLKARWGINISPMLIVSSGRPYNITTGRDLNGDTVFTDRPSFGVAGQAGVIETDYGFLNPTGVGQLIPRNYAQAPGFASLSVRLSKSIPLKKVKTAAPTGGTPTGGGPGGGGGDMHGGGGPPMGMGGGGRGFGGFGGGGGGGPTLSISINASNVLNRVNAGTPIGNLSSPDFGQSKSLAGFFNGFGGGGGSEAGNRRIELQLRANF